MMHNYVVERQRRQMITSYIMSCQKRQMGLFDELIDGR